ncbi:hypothetical protein [Microcoleus sp. herbarium14]|uniref:hypothetical protein n=1 Tax=Microcoleus sp. herbarium14 TaxID=3055439 RepID=UPI002FD1B513
MFTSLTETNPASEYQNPLSISFAFNDSSINYRRYFVSGILAADRVILVNSNSESIEQITSALQKYASILGEIDKVCTIYWGGSDDLEPSKTLLQKWQSSLTEKSKLGSCYADRDTDTLSNGDERDRLFANKESDAIIDRKVAVRSRTKPWRI